MNRAFSVAVVEETETTFAPEHVREDFFVTDVNLSQSEGDFCNLQIEVENPRVGLLAPGRPRWLWLAWNPTFDPYASESSEASFDDMVPLFFGRIQGVPADFIGDVVTLNFLARPLDFDTQKADLAATLRVAPWFDGVWFAPDDRDLPDNVLESRSALWHIDRVSHEVTTSDIITGEGGTITFDGGDVLDDSIRIQYGDPPCRQVNVTANVSWDQIASGSVKIVGDIADRVFDTYTGEGLQANWPKPGQNIGGDWTVGLSTCVRVDNNGKDVWKWGKALKPFEQGVVGYMTTMPSWAFPQVVLRTEFQGRTFAIKKWRLSTALWASYNTKRGRSETVRFSLRSNTQSVLTDSTDGEAVELTFNTSEVAAPVGVLSDGTVDVPLGRPSARRYITTDRGTQSLEYLILVARARLLSAARCVDVSFTIPWDLAIAEGVDCTKNIVLSDPSLPGGTVAGKVKSYSLTANGDSGTFLCEVTIGCTIGLGGTVTAVEGTPSYVNVGYVDSGYQVAEGAYAMPVAGEVAYEVIAGAQPNDDGIDFDRMTPGRVLAQAVQIDNQAPAQYAAMAATKPVYHPLTGATINTAPEEPSQLYAIVNAIPTTLSFALKPLNSGPFNDTYDVTTTYLSVPKTIDLEADLP